MKLVVLNHSYSYEMEKLTRIFLPDEKIEVKSEKTGENELVTEIDGEARVSFTKDGFHKSLTAPLSEDNELELGRLVYKILSEYTGFYPPWGVLTGVRPSKLLILEEQAVGASEAHRRFTEDFLVSEEKYSLAKRVADCEEKIISLSGDNSVSLYVSIPFCPSRCSYCSFVSHSIENAKAFALLEEYTNKLASELQVTGEIVREKGLKLESVYIGGGTPTTLSASQLSVLIDEIRRSFDLSACREFTVEAGRPDTITEEKLIALKQGGVTRISVNPQSFSDSVLRAVGRKHTASDAVKAYELAQNLGFDNINMDLIAGLPTDTLEGFKSSLLQAVSLNPQGITVHSLAIKRSAYINNGENALPHRRVASEMIGFSINELSKSYIPYYMYRQSKSAGSLENTGWCKQGFEGLYNVFMMEECHSVLACGGGAVTRLKAPSGKIQRIFNYKYPFEYISGFDTVLERKKGITRFYETYF